MMKTLPPQTSPRAIDELGHLRSRSVLACHFASLAVSLVMVGCTPRVEIATDKPIEININAKIDHEVRVKVERDVENLITKNKDLF